MKTLIIIGFTFMASTGDVTTTQTATVMDENQCHVVATALNDLEFTTEAKGHLPATTKIKAVCR